MGGVGLGGENAFWDPNPNSRTGEHTVAYLSHYRRARGESGSKRGNAHGACLHPGSNFPVPPSDCTCCRKRIIDPAGVCKQKGT
jgi:hypothetical protein